MATRNIAKSLAALLPAAALALYTFLAPAPANRALAQRLSLQSAASRPGSPGYVVSQCNPILNEEGNEVNYTFYIVKDPMTGRVVINSVRPTIGEDSMLQVGGPYKLVFEDFNRNDICTYPFDLENGEQVLVTPRPIDSETVRIMRDNLEIYRSHSLGRLLQAGFEREPYDLPNCTISFLFPTGAPCRELLDSNVRRVRDIRY